MSNNRSEISYKLMELKQEYENLDRFFYSNFKIQSVGLSSCCEYSRRIDSIKMNISNLWNLCYNHTGGWFDTPEKQELDQRHRDILSQIEQDVNKLISLYKSYDIRE